MTKDKDRHRGIPGLSEPRTSRFTDAPATDRGNSPRTVTATDAKNRFGELLDAARQAPVEILKNGRTVAVILSPEEYRALVETRGAPKVNPAVARLLEQSIRRRSTLYDALAK